MDDAPYTGDLNLGAVSTRDDLAAQLRTVHIRADKPSLRTLESRTRHTTSPLSKTVVAEMLKGMRFPRKAVMVAFLRACGIQDDDMDPWLRTWERIAAGEEAPLRLGAAQTAPGRRPDLYRDTKSPSLVPRDATAARRTRGRDADRSVRETSGSVEQTRIRKLREQLDQLRQDNEKLRAQIATTRQPSTKEAAIADTTTSHRARSPVVCRRELGALLSALRTERGVTVDEVAEHLMCSRSKVLRMETGFRAGTVRDVRDLCDMYGVTEAGKRDHLLDLARIGKQHSRWNLYEPPFSTYIELEAAADSIHCHHSAIIPGHVQTSDYARAILDNWMVPAGPESVEERVADRLNRQRWFSEPDPPEVSFIIGEEALHRLVGGPAVMRAQLERLIEVAELPNVTIRLIPYEAGAHLALDDSFVILGLTAPMDNIVYLETIFADLLFEHSQDVEKYQEAFARLGNVAASEEDSVARIAKIIREF